MISRTDKRFRFMVYFMAAILLLTSVFSVAMQSMVKADNTITIYFDTSCVGSTSGCSKTSSHGSHNWSKNMSMVYYHAYGGSASSTGLTAMEDIGKAGSDGGKLFKLTIDKSQYSYILFSSVSPWGVDGDDKLWQTKNYSLSGVKDKDIFILSSNGYNDGDVKKQDMYVRGTYDSGSDYTGGDANRFSIINMTSSSVTFIIRYTDETRNLDTDEWNGDKTITSADISATVAPKTYAYKLYSVPNSNVTDKPYQTVEIWDSTGTNLIKKYYFPQGKILGRTFMYGVTEFSGGSVLSYQTSDLGAMSAMDTNLYLDNASFYINKSADEKTKAEAAKITKYNGTSDEDVSGFSYLGRDGGNSQFKSANKVTMTSSSAPAAGMIDMKDYIRTLVHDNNKYNFFAAKEVGDNLICINDNVAAVSGKYTLQSIDVVLTDDNGNVVQEDGQDVLYATTTAEMYDYQYDSFNNSKYNYSRRIRVYFITPWWANQNKIYDPCVYTTDGKLGDFPGDKMHYESGSDGQEKTWYYDILMNKGDEICKLDFSFKQKDDNVTKQTDDLVINSSTTTRGFRYQESSWHGDGNRFNVTRYDPGNNKVADSTDHSSLKGDAKRPYLAINEAISADTSHYTSAATNYPLYLGQFWLPRFDSNNFGGSFDTSQEMYSSTTAAKQRAGHNGDDERYYYDTANDIGYYGFFGFGNTLKYFNWSANLAYRYANQDGNVGDYRPYNIVVQDLVNDTLVNGKLVANDGSSPIPYFDPSWWGNDGRDNFTTSQGYNVDLRNYIKTYSDLTFPFFKTPASKLQDFHSTDDRLASKKMVTDQSRAYSGDYYVFDSTKNVVRYDSTKNDLKKYYNDSSKLVGDNYGDDGTGSNTGLFPFNDRADGYNHSQSLHYGFGVKFSIDFYLNENGTLDGTTSGTPITFTFQGDDDVWVFLDDQLVLDMGGAHKNAIGEINFANQTVSVGSAVSVNNNPLQIGNDNDSKTVAENSVPRKQDTPFSNAIKSVATTGKHKITMYYLERGMLNSNLYVMFNLPMSLTKWELQEDTDVSGVNAGFAAATKYVADQDVFNYAVYNKDTTNVVGSEYNAKNNTSVSRNSSSDGGTSTTLSTGTGNDHTYNYDLTNVVHPSGSDYNYVLGYDTDHNTGVTYRLLDMFAGGGTTPVITDTRLYNNTGQSNIVSLQYGELATFNKQFSYGSMFRVEQLDTLSSPSGGSRAAGYNDSTGRSVSKYYNTYFQEDKTGTDKRRLYAGIYRGDDVAAKSLSHVENMYGDTSGTSWVQTDSAKNYSTNYIVNPQVDGNALTYNFSDPKDAANEYVHLRQVVVNEVKTAKLTIGKQLLISTDDSSDTFTFTITFSNVFGSSDASVPNVQYDLIGYKKYNSDGTEVSGPFNLTGQTFQLIKGQYIVIEDIPVGTKYYITETNSGSTYVYDGEHSINMGTQASPYEIIGNTNATAFNGRQTGSVSLVKQLFMEDGTTQANPDATEFTANVTLTVPTGMSSFAGYDIRVNGEGVSVNNGTAFDVRIKYQTAVTITGLPYGTTYEVTEVDPPSGYARLMTFTRTSGDDVSGNVQYMDSTKQIDTPAADIVNIYNKLNPIIMPETGGTPLIFLLPFGIVALALSGGALVIYKKKLQRLHYHKVGKGRSE